MTQPTPFRELTRREQWENLLRRIREQRQEIAQIFEDGREWNDAHPGEEIEIDPGGELLKAMIQLDASHADLLTKEPTP